MTYVWETTGATALKEEGRAKGAVVVKAEAVAKEISARVNFIVVCLGILLVDERKMK